MSYEPPKLAKREAIGPSDGALASIVSSMAGLRRIITWPTWARESWRSWNA